MKPQRRLLLLLGAIWLLALLLAACSLPTPAPAGPKVTIVSPAEGNTVFMGDVIGVRATAEDAKGIAWIELQIDDQPAGIRYTPPITAVTQLTQELRWQVVSTGITTHTVKVVAQNNLGSLGESSPIHLYVVPPNASVIAAAQAAEAALATPSPLPFPASLPTIPYTPLPTLPPTLTPLPPIPTPVPTFTPAPTFTRAPTPTPLPTICYDNAVFVADVNVPDGTLLDQGAAFNKTWRMQNYGNCRWDSSYQLVFIGGSQMSGPSPISLQQTVPPGAMVDITVPMIAPNAMGSYTGQWQMRSSSSGRNFGPAVLVTIQVNPGANDAPIINRFEVIPTSIQPGQTATIYWQYINGAYAVLILPSGQNVVGASGQLPVSPSTTTSYQLIVNNPAGTTYRTVTLFVQPVPVPLAATPVPSVTAPSPPANLSATEQATVPAIYDFVMQAQIAAWSSGAGGLTFPGIPGDERGLARWTGSGETLEDGSQPSRALETDPNANPGGWVVGEYFVPIPLQAGDRIKARVGFLKGVAADATFSLQVDNGNGGPVTTLAHLHHATNGPLEDLSADLSPYAGQMLRFRLRVDAGSQPSQDHAVWVSAQLVRP